jgi:hypothetical protein
MLFSTSSSSSLYPKSEKNGAGDDGGNEEGAGDEAGASSLWRLALSLLLFLSACIQQMQVRTTNGDH